MRRPGRSAPHTDVARLSPSASGTGERAGSECGAVLVAVLLLTVILGAIGLTVSLVVDVEHLMAAYHRDGLRLHHAAEGVADVVVDELAGVADWAPAPGGGTSPRLPGALVLSRALGGGPFDAPAATLALQQAAYSGNPWGVDTPRWRLFGQGVPGSVLPFAGLPDDVYAIVWVSDDVADGDGDARVDSNGVEVLRVRVIGPRRARADVQLVIARVAPGVVRRVSSRTMR